MKPKYDMVCVKEAYMIFGFVRAGEKCRILDFKRRDTFIGGMIIALEFECFIGGHDARYAFPDTKGKCGHCIYVDQKDMKHFKFI